MPIYEYECENCGQTLEAFQKISDKPLESCKLCNGKLHKLISQSSFHLKGTGWYVTDYSKKTQTNTKTDKTSQKAENKNSKDSNTSNKAAEKASE